MRPRVALLVLLTPVAGLNGQMPDAFLAYVAGPGRLLSIAAMQAAIWIHADRMHFRALITPSFWVAGRGAEAEAAASRSRNRMSVEACPAECGIIPDPCLLNSLWSEWLNDLQRAGAGV